MTLTRLPVGAPVLYAARRGPLVYGVVDAVLTASTTGGLIRLRTTVDHPIAPKGKRLCVPVCRVTRRVRAKHARRPRWWPKLGNGSDKSLS